MAEICRFPLPGSVRAPNTAYTAPDMAWAPSAETGHPAEPAGSYGVMVPWPGGSPPSALPSNATARVVYSSGKPGDVDLVVAESDARCVTWFGRYGVKLSSASARELPASYVAGSGDYATTYSAYIVFWS